MHHPSGPLHHAPWRLPCCTALSHLARLRPLHVRTRRQYEEDRLHLVHERLLDTMRLQRGSDNERSHRQRDSPWLQVLTQMGLASEPLPDCIGRQKVPSKRQWTGPLLVVTKTMTNARTMSSTNFVPHRLHNDARLTKEFLRRTDFRVAREKSRIHNTGLSNFLLYDLLCQETKKEESVPIFKIGTGHCPTAIRPLARTTGKTGKSVASAHTANLAATHPVPESHAFWSRAIRLSSRHGGDGCNTVQSTGQGVVDCFHPGRLRMAFFRITTLKQRDEPMRGSQSAIKICPFASARPTMAGNAKPTNELAKDSGLRRAAERNKACGASPSLPPTPSTN